MRSPPGVPFSNSPLPRSHSGWVSLPSPPMRALEQQGLDALRDRSRARLNMPPIVIGQAVSLFGDYIAYVTLPLLVLSITGRPEDLGLVAAAETLPLLCLGSWPALSSTGTPSAASSFSPMSCGLRCSFGLAALGASRDVEVWVVFVVAFLVGSLSLVFDSGLQALLPALTGDSYLVDINSRLSLARTLAWSIGPAIGGVLVASSGGFTLAFIVDGATFLVSAVFLLRVRELRPVERARHTNIGQQLRRGIRFLFREPHLRWATVGAAMANLVFAPLEALLGVVRCRTGHGRRHAPVLTRVALSRPGPGRAVHRLAGCARLGRCDACAPGCGPLESGSHVHRRPGAARFRFRRRRRAEFLLVRHPRRGRRCRSGVGQHCLCHDAAAPDPEPPTRTGYDRGSNDCLAPDPRRRGFGGYLAAEFGLVAVYVAGSILALAGTALLMFTPLWTRPVREVDEPAWSSSRLQSLKPIDAPPQPTDPPQ